MTERSGADSSAVRGKTERTPAREAALDPEITLQPAEPHLEGDAQMARRLALGTAALAEAESRPAVDISGLVGDEEREPALGYYLVLGAMVAALLVIVIGYSGSHRPVDTGALQGALHARMAPSIAPDRSPRLLAPPMSPTGRLPTSQIAPIAPDPAATTGPGAGPMDVRPSIGQAGRIPFPSSAPGAGLSDQTSSPGHRPALLAPIQSGGQPGGSHGATQNREAPSGASSPRRPEPSLQLHVPPLLAPASPGSLLPGAPPISGGAGRPRWPSAP